MRRISLLFTIALLMLGLSLPAFAQAPVARVVYFFSPTCPHCHKVSTEDLPPLRDKYGEQLQIFEVDTTTSGGQRLYQNAVVRFGITQDRVGVPTMVVGSTVLVGEVEIPQQLPGLIDAGLAAGGIAWPDIDGLLDRMPVSLGGRLPDAAAGDVFADIGARLARDPLGNGIAIVVLAGMIAIFARVSYRLWSTQPGKLSKRERRKLRTQAPATLSRAWLVPLLAVVGLLVAIYLTFVEVTNTEAICGPVGDCNAVQQSPYAYFLGFLPVGLMGVLGYIAILGAWAAGYFGGASLAKRAPKMLFWFSAFGVLFSIYLTFLEPFVIGATCVWCLTSAIVVTALFWLSAKVYRGTLRRETGSSREPMGLHR
jgi:uncharacterized membrane protein